MGNGQTQANIWSFQHTHNLCFLVNDHGMTCPSVAHISAIPTNLPSQAGKIPGMYNHVFSTIPSIQNYVDDIPSIISKLNTLANSIFDIELILAQRHNQTMDELKQYLDGLHSRVQLRPTAAPTLTPSNDPTLEPTIDPTTEPTSNPTEPSTNPTIDPTQYPTAEPTTSICKVYMCPSPKCILCPYLCFVFCLV